jgi:hypothetical protein
LFDLDIATIALIVIGLIVIIYTIATDNINWFYVKVWIPLGAVWILLWDWLDLL